MPVLNLEFEVYCSCGEGLCNNSIEGENGHSKHITVTPCEKCRSYEYDRGYDDGYEKGKEDFEPE